MAMEEAIVSIIMPMHNSSAFLKEAIESVIAQTYQQWELIVIDDASSDCSREIVLNFQKDDSRIQLLSNENSIGLPSAPRNLGIRHARGRYVAFLDSDDCWLPNKLKRQLTLFDGKDVAIVFSDYEKMNEHGDIKHRIVKAPNSITYKDLLNSNYIGNLTGIYDRKLVGEVYLPNIHHEDYAFWLSILKKGYVARNTSTVEALYRIRAKSVSSSKINLLTWQWDIYRKEEHLSFLMSLYHYVIYAYKGWRKSLI